MNLRGLFKSADNVLEGSPNKNDGTGKTEEKSYVYKCPNCKSMLTRQGVREHDYSCPECDYYFHISARKRILMYADSKSFDELMAGVESENIIGFPEYDQKLLDARKKSGEKEGVVCGRITIGKMPCCIFSMDANFMMGSMGTVVGEKITALFEYATRQQLPVIGVTVSGGARMQEGMLSLLQMAKVSGAVKKHSDAGLLYVVLMTNPTTGGVEASFAMEGDIILAEPNALIGFAGPRVIQQTLKKKLPKGFQRSEALLKCGFVDDIVRRIEQREYLEQLLLLHGGRAQ
ncbi:MAG TPA: acetyl-CoA carboxylase, carboxyltransferase subunit beta [Lachnospiraceae bacterium]|nr:acetyl-CoA carboxylase, carboxyltransferase subunit beta [Lachnospiraceae bacterium]